MSVSDFYQQLLQQLPQMSPAWHFDLLTSILTLIILPFMAAGAIAVKKFVKDNTKYALDGVLYYLSRALTRRIAAQLTLRQYARLLLQRSDKYLRVPAFRDIRLDIDRIYVPLSLESALDRASVYDHKTLFKAGNRLRLIGDPGSGKSSIAKKIVRDECARILERQAHLHLPILIELRSMSIPTDVSDDKLGGWFLEFLRTQVKYSSLYEVEKCFDVFSCTNGLLVLLDGLDEVSSTLYERMKRAINGLSEELGKLSEHNILIMTLRTQFHQQIRGDFEELPVVLSLKRFSAADIYQFLTMWPFPDDKRFAAIVRIYANLADQPALREMCTNPLILAMYVAQDQAREQESSPETRTGFYTDVVDELLIHRRASQIGAIQQRTLMHDQRRKIFGRIAFNHLVRTKEATNHIAWKDGIEAVRLVVKCDFCDSERILRELSKETGLITEERLGESFRFIHLTFCEYFAAFEAAMHRRNGWNEIVTAFQEFNLLDSARARLVEVMPFACALMAPYNRSDAISVLYSIGQKYVIALSFLETKLYDHPCWRTFKDAYQAELISETATNWGLEWLSKVHTFLVVCADAERTYKVTSPSGHGVHNEVEEFFQEFSRLSEKDISVLITSFATQDAAAAFNVAALCGINVSKDIPQLIIDHVNQPVFLALVLKLADENPLDIALWATLLSEAALRSQSAAVQIALAAPIKNITARLNERRVKNWYLDGIMQESFYRECLNVSLMQEDVSFKFVMLKRLLPVKHLYVYGYSFSRYVFGLSSVAMFWIVYTCAAWIFIAFEIHIVIPKTHPGPNQLEGGDSVNVGINVLTGIIRGVTVLNNPDTSWIILYGVFMLVTITGLMLAANLYIAHNRIRYCIEYVLNVPHRRALSIRDFSLRLFLPLPLEVFANLISQSYRRREDGPAMLKRYIYKSIFVSLLLPSKEKKALLRLLILKISRFNR